MPQQDNMYVNVGQYADLGVDPELFGYVSGLGKQQDEEIPEGVLSRSEYNDQAKALYDQYKQDGDIKALGEFLMNNQYYDNGQSRSFLETFGDNPLNKKGQINLEKVSMADLPFLDRKDKAILAAGLAPMMLGMTPERALNLATGGTFSVDKNGQRRFEWSNSVAGELGTLGMAAVGALTMGVGAPALAGAMGISNAAAGALINAGMTGALGGDLGDMAKSGLLSYAAPAVGGKVSQLTSGLGSATSQALGNLAYGAVRTGGDVNLENLLTGSILEEQGLLPSGGGQVFDIAKAVHDKDYGKLYNLTKDYIDLPDSGNLGNFFETPEFLKKLDDAVFRPMGQTLAEFDKSVLQPLYQPAGDALANLDKNVLQGIYQPVAQGAEQLGKDIANAVNPLDNWVDDISLPEVNLPNINWGGLFGGLLGGLQGMTAGGGGGRPMVAQAPAIKTELQDYKAITPYRSTLMQNIRG